MKKHVLLSAAVFLVSFGSCQSQELPRTVTQRECDDIKKQCAAEGKKLQTAARGIKDTVKCKSPSRSEGAIEPRGKIVEFYSMDGPIAADLSLESLKALSGGPCLVSVKIARPKCNVQCKTAAPWVDSLERLFYLEAVRGNTVVTVKAGRPK